MWQPSEVGKMKSNAHPYVMRERKKGNDPVARLERHIFLGILEVGHKGIMVQHHTFEKPAVPDV